MINRVVWRCAALLALSAGGREIHAQGAAATGDSLPVAQRQRLQARLRLRVEEILQQRLELTDEQTRRMSDLWVQLEPDRRALLKEDRETRAALRAELLAGSQGNETRVRELMDRISTLDRRRLDLRDREQRELSQFLSPTQRARFFALQDELRRSVSDVQNRRTREELVRRRRPPF
jgi:periplasmic protein CpxP/Spy